MTNPTDSGRLLDIDIDLHQHLDELVLDETDDDDEPVLRWKDGPIVDTWREGYPYDERIARAEYDRTKRLLQIELLKLQNWVKETGQRIVILFEGRDAAGKGGTIKRFMEHLNPAGRRVVALEKPSERERRQWYFQRYVHHLPAAGEIVLFDRSWYNRAGVERVMGFCTDAEYLEFMRQAPSLRTDARPLRDPPGQVLVLGVAGRAAHALHHPPGSIPYGSGSCHPMDLASLDKWDEYTEAKEAMFFYTDTADAPWTVVKSNDKKRARIEAMRHVLYQFDYPVETTRSSVCRTRWSSVRRPRCTSTGRRREGQGRSCA